MGGRADTSLPCSDVCLRLSAAGTCFGAFLKIDTGYHRAGVDVVRDPERAMALATKLSEAKALKFRGVYSHSGIAPHSQIQRTQRGKFRPGALRASCRPVRVLLQGTLMLRHLVKKLRL
jgi:D-serine deaminase-like pyridoxal phosphate-dependent protein